MRRLALAVVAAALAVTAPTPAGADDGECPDNQGITVVVDFKELGGGVVVACAPATVDDPVASGFDALGRAEVPYDHFRDFICRLYGKPENACGGYPSASAYWSYWLAARGGEWCYANVGAAREPPPGSVDGWSFALNRSGRPIPPAYPVPGPIPGQAPNPIAPGDCEGSSAQPTTTRSPSPPPTPTTATPGDPGRGQASSAAAVASPPPASLDPTTPDGTSTGLLPAPSGDTGTSTANTVVAGEPVAGDPDPLESAKSPESPPAEDAARFIGVRPPTPTSSPTGTAVAVGIVTVLIGLSAWLRRRQPGD